jgi:ribosomal protein L12E/L44/L45/RPP1/RPP2
VADDIDNDENLANLRKMAKDGKSAIDRAQQLERENLFLRAGIDLDTKLGKMLFKTYEGDSLEDLRTEAKDIGLLTGNTNPASTQTSNGNPAGDEGDDEDTERQMRREQQRQRQTITGGKPGGEVSTETPHPVDAAYKDFYEDRAKGVRLENAQLGVIDKVLVAAGKGDKRVIFDQRAWDDQARRDSETLRRVG